MQSENGTFSAYQILLGQFQIKHNGTVIGIYYKPEEALTIGDSSTHDFKPAELVELGNFLMTLKY